MFLLRYLAFQKFGAVIFEHAALIVAVFMLQVHIAALTPESFVLGLSKAFVVAMTFQTSLHLMDGYDFGVNPWKPEFLLDFAQAVLVACIVLSAAHLILPELVVQGEYLIVTLVGISFGLAAWHFLVRVYFGV